MLADIAIERAVLSIIYHHNYEAFVEIQDTLVPESFTYDSNKLIFKCFSHIFENNDQALLDYPSVYSASAALNAQHFFQDRAEVEHFEAIVEFPSKRENLFDYTKKLHKLHIARLIHDQLQQKSMDVLEFNGDENVDNLLGIIEFDFSQLLMSGDECQTIGSDLRELVKQLEENPVDQVGISTGYPVLDQALGGGLRGSAVSIFGARPGIGKSTICNNIANYVADIGIPALYLDTEMSKVDQQYRLLALNSGVPINDIETGKFGELPAQKQKILKATTTIEDKPYFHKNIAGMPFQDQLAIMRKWIINNVGLDENGKAKKKCVILYDYLKLMDSAEISGSLQEFQALGFMITTLHNLSVRYDIPVVGTIQLNRDGITKETTDAASGSDRIIWLCSNFVIFKPKSDEEIAKDGDTAGNRKMVILKTRHGPGMDSKNYINYKLTGNIGLLEEGYTSFELFKQSKEKQEEE